MEDSLRIILTLCGIVLVCLPLFLLITIRKVGDEIRKGNEERRQQADALQKMIRELIFAVKARG